MEQGGIKPVDRPVVRLRRVNEAAGHRAPANATLEDLLPVRQAARFSFVYTLAIVLGTLIVVVGVDPLKLTNVAMVLSAAVLPVAVVPFLFLMNDRHYVGEHTNGWIGNGVVVAIIGLAFVLAVVALPLQILGG